MSQSEDSTGPRGGIELPGRKLPEAPEFDEGDVDTRFYPAGSEDEGLYNGRTIVKDHEVWRHYVLNEDEILECTTVFDLAVAEIEFDTGTWDLAGDDSPLKDDETVAEFCDRHFELFSPEIDYRMCMLFSEEYTDHRTQTITVTDEKTGGRVIMN